MSKDPGSELIAVTFGAQDPSALARFWATAMRWDVGVERDGCVELIPTDGTRFTLAFEPATPDQTSRQRLHLDLTTSSLEDQQQTADALVELGGRPVDNGQDPSEGFFVLADPEGNLFCLIEPDNQVLADCPRLGAVNCDGTRATGVFWSEALGWPLIWDQDEETAIRHPDGTGPKITWSGPPLNDKPGRNRLHLDLAPGGDPVAEVARLTSLGATQVLAADGELVELLDPDGNEFRLSTSRI